MALKISWLESLNTQMKFMTGKENLNIHAQGLVCLYVYIHVVHLCSLEQFMDDYSALSLSFSVSGF